MIGFSPIASAHQVTQYREKVMVAKKQDWKTEDKLIHQNKVGKNKAIPTETTVLMVKKLPSYILKFAEAESIELDLG